STRERGQRAAPRDRRGPRRDRGLLPIEGHRLLPVLLHRDPGAEAGATGDRRGREGAPRLGGSDRDRVAAGEIEGDAADPGHELARPSRRELGGAHDQAHVGRDRHDRPRARLMSGDFTELVDLAAERLGGSVLWATDDFFAEKENLLKPAEAVFVDGKYTDRGKWMDGWESRRKRNYAESSRAYPEHDTCI